MKKLVLVAIAGISLHFTVLGGDKKKNSTDPVILNIGTKAITASEFQYVYNKNNANSPDAYSEKSIADYLELYIKFRLKVLEAEDLGMDTTNSFKKELDGYKKQLAQPYLTEKSVTEKLIKEAYARMQEEVKASHILIRVGLDADPKDTLVAYTKLMDIRKKALDGQSFDALAKKYSEDPSAQTNGGNLGYFTALQMVYPFEEGAYTTPVGQISMPVRTKFGYHIIKVADKRKASGEVKVAHIMIRYSTGTNPEDSAIAYKKASEILAKIKKGDDFNALCAEYSEDMNSKSKGGELPPFSTGNMIPSFEEASFKLEKIGDISEVSQTPYGFHIIKLLERKGTPKYEDIENMLKNKVSKDGRSDMSKVYLINRLKKENKFVENTKIFNLAISKADSSLLKAKFSFDNNDKIAQSTLFSIADKKYSVLNFFDYIKAKQKARNNISAQAYMRQLYKDYVNESLLAYEEANLESKYNDYKMLVREYRDGILLFSLMDSKVWSKAVEDTAGLKAFYAKNKSNYMWNKRYEAQFISCNNKTTFDLVKSKLDSKYFDVPFESTKEATYAKAKFDVKGDIQKAADDVVNILNRDKNYVVEITFGSEVGESTNPKISLTKQRTNAFTSYLTSKGIDKSRIIVKEKANQPVVKGKDNKMVSFKYSSTSISALEKTLNQNAPLTLQIKENKFQVGEDAIIDAQNWKIGYNEYQKGEKYYIINVKQIIEPSPKTLEEAKGSVISDYQNELEKLWIDGLKGKYKVTVNDSEIKKLVKK